MQMYSIRERQQSRSSGQGGEISRYWNSTYWTCCIRWQQQSSHIFVSDVYALVQILKIKINNLFVEFLLLCQSVRVNFN